ncbi:MAG: TraR/DksA C4-type zinc finger protein [Chloroflexota bacterium]|nr:TraR/DksA C4-type zinc finger protein [Chloroflexota bacterium]MDE3101144.1 TraR/DksA C4-type zinc finger protein [Chloroflexota bacterium]
MSALRSRLQRDLGDTENTLEAIRERTTVGQQESGGEISLSDQHPADAATETESRELDLAQQRMLGSRVRRIQDALHRMDDGTYGRCVVCGSPIPEERLEAIPDTAYCLKDATAEERT